MSKTYKAGIIGCGGISASHFGGLADTGRVEFIAAYDKDPAAAKAAGEKWNVPTVDSAEQVLEKDPDIVVIATPGFAHRQYVEMAAAAGKHIVCEKPIALNLDDATAIKKAVDEAGVLCQVSFNHRNAAEYVTLKSFQESGRLDGTVSAWARLHAPASSDRWRQIQKTGHWRASMELSGGRINEFCSHTINWLLWVLGKPKTVYGRALRVTRGFELDDADYALIECENGVGMLEVNRHAGVTQDANFGIMGHGGSVVLKERKITFKPMDEEPEDVPIREDVPTKHEHFVECLDTGKPLVNDVDAAIETLRLCLAFNRSAESGRVEEV